MKMWYIMSIDSVIFAGFLVTNLTVGLFYSQGIKTTSEYAIGNRNFSTNTMISTIVATSVGAGVFSSALTESYRQGLYFIIPIVLGDMLSLATTGFLLIPRMGEFLGSLSVADAMGKLYGKWVRVITAITGALFSVGVVALQFKVASSVLQIFWDMPGFYASILSAAIVIFYSSLGGIRGVTFTDVLQFFTFGTVVPLICIAIWRNSNVEFSEAFITLSQNSLFDYKTIFSFDNPKLLPLIFLSLTFVIPALNPCFFQRVSMASSVNQGQKSFIISGLMCGLILLITCWVGVLLFLNNPELEADKLLSHIINNYTFTGLKGLTAIGIMAIIMSTADSYINAASVLIENDIIKPLNSKFLKVDQELKLLRIVAVLVGIAAFILSVKTGSLLSLFVRTLSFYMPIVSVPLLLAIFGFRSNAKVVITGMIAGAVMVILGSIYMTSEDGTTFLGMLANLIAFTIAHFLSGKPNSGGNQDYKETLTRLKSERTQNINTFLLDVKNSAKTYRQNFISGDSFHVLPAIFTLVIIFSTLHLIPHHIQNAYVDLFSLIYISTLVLVSVLIIYPILPARFMHHDFIVNFRMIAIPYIFVLVPTMLLVISKFDQFAFIIFILSVMTFIFLVRWQVALFMLPLSCALSYFVNHFICSNQPYGLNLGLNLDIDTDRALYSKIIYVLLLIASLLIGFLRPKQAAHDLSEEMNRHLSDILEERNQEITKLSNLTGDFLRNLQHETNTPLTGVYSISQALMECYDKLDDEQRKNAIFTIANSSERLISYASNLIDVSKLLYKNYHLNIRNVNLSNLLQECVRKCRKLYITKDKVEDREIRIDAPAKLILACDEYYIRKSFENLLINAIQYCKKGLIEVSLSQDENKILFKVKDEGIGIPKEDLVTIFNPFMTSSKTKTPAGGRGLGLTLVKEVARMHHGKVEVTSDDRGSIFTMSLLSA